MAPSLVRGWHELPDWSRSLAWSGLAYTLVQMTVLEWLHGRRHLLRIPSGLELLACATPALAFSAHRMGAVTRRLVGPVIAVEFFAIFVGASLDSFYVASSEAW